jgi:hypothetical protein
MNFALSKDLIYIKQCGMNSIYIYYKEIDETNMHLFGILYFKW